MIACPYCDSEAKLITGAILWPRLPHLADKHFWRCDPCDAHVGCHPNTTRPLGRMANKPLRAARMAAHQAFDPLWQRKIMPRSAAYAWLADKLGIAVETCHIAHFNRVQCAAVVLECREFLKNRLP